MNDTYLNWAIENTRTKWWHDSAQAVELDLGLERGAIGVTTNPFLSSTALHKDREYLGERNRRRAGPEPALGAKGRGAHADSGYVRGGEVPAGV